MLYNYLKVEGGECLLISKFNNGKIKAINKGISKCQELKILMNKYSKSSSLGDNDKFCGVDPIDYCDNLFEQNEYIDYVKISMIAKHYERLYILICIIYIAIYFCLMYVLYNSISLIIFSAIALILGAILVLIIAFNSSMSYKKYYKKTIYDLLFSYGNLEYNLNNKSLDDLSIKEIIYNDYTSKMSKNNMNFSGSVFGNINDIELKNTKKIKDKKGNEVSHTSKVFKGFYLKINSNKAFNLLKGNVINIIQDENLVSSLLEDTVKGIYESDLEFNFNSEELNKSLDCKVSGYKGFVDADGVLMSVNKIITPSFEQHLLYLRKRYNSFNMKISDKCLIVSFDMRRSLFQQLKHGELFDLNTTYREANIFVPNLKGKLFGIDDFAYYNIFPTVERIFLINYLSYLYCSSFDFSYYYDTNNSVINSFESKMLNICDTKISEFKKIKKENLDKITDRFSEILEEFKKEG